MRKVALVQARMSSSRLPGKVLKTLGSKEVLAWVVDAVRNVDALDEVVIVTSDEASDDSIQMWCDNYSVNCFRGSLQNVLSRYVQAAKLYEADAVMRLTADCPFLDPSVCSQLIDLFLSGGADYVSNTLKRTYPHGLDCEIFTAETLYLAAKRATTEYHREHVTPYIYREGTEFQLATLEAESDSYANYRWTLDYLEDYTLLNKIALILEDKQLTPTIENIIDVMQGNPSLKDINAEHAAF